METSPQKCRVCSLEKPLSDFYGVRTECKECVKARVSAYRKRVRGDRTNYVWLSRKLWKLKNRAKLHNWSFDLDIDFVHWLYNEPHACEYCKEKGLSTFDRKENTKGYTKDNLVVACYRCNYMKGNQFSYEDMLILGRALRKIDKKRFATIK